MGGLGVGIGPSGNVFGRWMWDGAGLAGELVISGDVDLLFEDSSESEGGESVSRVIGLWKGVIVSLDFASCL